MQATNWVLGGWDGAAARLGLSRTTLISRMQRLGISAGSGLRTVSEPAGPLAVAKRTRCTTAGRWLIERQTQLLLPFPRNADAGSVRSSHAERANWDAVVPRFRPLASAAWA